MPNICPVCSKSQYSYQSSIQCDSCNGWIHHGNRLNCSGLTDSEFNSHQLDEHKHFDCDHCIIERNAKNKSSIFQRLPFSHECDDNIFNAPTLNQRDDVCSMSPEELRKFVVQCKSIQKVINSDENIDDDDFFSTQVNSKYYNMKQLNLLKPDVSSSFGLLHVNIASLNAHIDDLKNSFSQTEN